MRYPGGKGGAGVYQTIINNIPPHDTYIETHLGGGNILERKRPAARSVGIDVDPEVIEVWRQLDVPGLELHHGDAVAWLESHQFTGSEFVYADPPYVMDSRRGGKLYRHEYDDADHVRLLDVLAGLPSWAYRTHSWAGLALGWIHKPVSLLAAMPYGRGHMAVTTFKLNAATLATDAVAQALFAGALGLL